MHGFAPQLKIPSSTLIHSPCSAVRASGVRKRLVLAILIRNTFISSDPKGPEVYIGGQTDEQARAQFTMWSLFPANLLISQNVLAWSPYALETYSNVELIAVNQDPLGSPAKRIVGGNLEFPCNSSPAKPCNSSNVWGRQLSGGTFALGFVNNAGSAAKITCDGNCFNALNISSSVTELKVRDLWAHADVATLKRPFTFTAAVNGSGFAAAYVPPLCV